jgi:hypothetical protein
MRQSPLLSVAVLTAALVALTGCAPTATPADWKVEPVSWDTQTSGKVDVAFGMSAVAADGAGGFWSESAGSWLHVGADGDTLVRFNIEPDHPLHAIGYAAALSPTELVAILAKDTPDAAPGLSIIDMETLEYTDVRTKPLPEDAPDASGTDFGDFEFGALAEHEGAAYVIRYQPTPPEPTLDAEILRIDLDTGERELVHREALTFGTDPSDPGVPEVDLDIDDEGRIYMATPANRIVLAPDGTELARTPQTATHPVVAVRPDGLALWWGGDQESAAAESVIVGGSGEARRVIEERQSCDAVYRVDTLHITFADEELPAPQLCSPNAAAWVGESWVVAIGGEGDGVLVRLTPPDHFPPGGPTSSSTT